MVTHPSRTTERPSFTVDFDGVPITVYSREEALALARDIQHSRSAPAPAVVEPAQQESGQRQVGGLPDAAKMIAPAVSRGAARAPKEAKTPQERLAELRPGSRIFAYRIGDLLLGRSPQFVRKTQLEEDLRLSSHDIYRGFGWLAAWWETKGGNPNELVVRRTAGRQAMFAAGGRLLNCIQLLIETYPEVAAQSGAEATHPDSA